MVYGISASFCDQLPSEMYAVAWLFAGQPAPAADRARVQVAVGPQRHPPLRRARSRRVCEAQRVVPHQRADVVPEERAVVADAHDRVDRCPFGGDAELGRAGVDGRRQFDGVAEAECARPWLLAALLRVLERTAQIEIRRRAVGSRTSRCCASRRSNGVRLRVVRLARRSAGLHESTAGHRRAERRRAHVAEQRTPSACSVKKSGDLIPLEEQPSPFRNRHTGPNSADHDSRRGSARTFNDQQSSVSFAISKEIQRRPVPQIAIPLRPRLVGLVAVDRPAKCRSQRSWQFRASGTMPMAVVCPDAVPVSCALAHIEANSRAG